MRDTHIFHLILPAHSPKPRLLVANTMAIGALAQLGERLHGMQEVSGSIPLGSTKHFA